MPYALGPEHLGNPFAVGTQRRYPTARGHRLIVSDVKVACNKLLARGVVIGQMFHAKACTLDEFQPGWTVVWCGDANPQPHSHGSIASLGDSLRHKHDLSELLDELLDTANLYKTLD